MKNLIQFFLILAVFCSCSKIEYNDSDLSINGNPTSKVVGGDYSEQMMVLGKKLNNPYRVDIMKLALQSLEKKGENLEISPSDIEPTHYYIRFLPQNSDELSELFEFELDLYDYPLDYEIESYGNYYHDPSIPDTLPTFYYASVSAGYWSRIRNSIDIQFSVLDNLFIPEQYNMSVKSSVPSSFSSSFSDDFIEIITDEAMRLTGNESEILPAGSRGRWTPQGRICSYDDILQEYLPLENVKVRARSWFTTYIGYTDSKGYFKCDGTFKKTAKYSIVWESSRWNIRDGKIVQAYYNAPEITGDWILNIGGGKSLRYATIHRALQRYYYGNIDGLSRPLNSRKVNVAYMHKSGKDTYGDFFWMPVGIFQDIRIYGKDNESWRNVAEIYSTTVHELGHLSHYTALGRNLFYNTSNFIVESWAVFVQHLLVKKEYQELGGYGKISMPVYTSLVIDTPPIRYTKIIKGLTPTTRSYYEQYWTKSGKGLYDYSPIFVDLNDELNQQLYYRSLYINKELSSYSDYNEYPYDEIYNVEPKIIEKMAFSSRNIDQLKQNLLDYADNLSLPNYNGITRNSIETLFQGYIRN